MKKQPRLSPVLLAISLFLVSGPLPAAAQMRAQVGAGSSAGVPVVPAGRLSTAIGSGISSPHGSIIGLNSSLAAPGLAPAPLVSVVPTSALSAAATSDGAKAIVVGAPDGSVTRIAEEAAAYAEGSAAADIQAAKTPAPAVKKSVAGRILDAFLRRPAASVSFDGAVEKSAPIFARMGLKEQKPLSLPNGSAPDEQPTIPSPEREPTTRVEAYGLPDARDVGGIFETSRKVLAADPSNATAVVDAVRAMIDADPARYGVASSDLRLIHAQKFTGKGGQADAFFVYFRQTKNGLIVNGASLSFTIKILDGRPTIVAQTGQVFPQIDVNTETVLTDDQIMGRIAERTGMPAADVSAAFEFYEQKIIYARGAWHNVKLYISDLPFLVAVDVVTGAVFAWDNRTGLESFARAPVAPNAGGVSGKISGNTVDRGPILANSVISEVPMPFLEVKIGGKSYVTDKDGALPSDLEIGPEGLELAATLSGPYVRVENQQGKTLTVKVEVKPGENKVVFNPGTGITDENTLAQINAFHKVNLSLNFLRERGLSNERMDKIQLPVRTNINDECNAFYTPGRPTLNFFRSSKNCVNSAYDTVAEHENGHFWDDFTGGIVNGGMSEGWGDILSMFRLNNPIIGEHFLKRARDGVDYIRNGENTYQYNEYDEVHDQGQAWGGFAWKLRKALMAKLGDEEGAATAESLVMPTMFAKASTIPDAMAQVLVNATGKDGAILHEAEIRAAAKAHGISLPSAAAATSTGFAPGGSAAQAARTLKSALIDIHDYLDKESAGTRLSQRQLDRLAADFQFILNLPDSSIPAELLGHLEGTAIAARELFKANPAGRDVSAVVVNAEKLRVKVVAIPTSTGFAPGGSAAQAARATGPRQAGTIKPKLLGAFSVMGLGAFAPAVIPSALASIITGSAIGGLAGAAIGWKFRRDPYGSNEWTQASNALQVVVSSVIGTVAGGMIGAALPSLVMGVVGFAVGAFLGLAIAANLLGNYEDKWVIASVLGLGAVVAALAVLFI